MVSKAMYEMMKFVGQDYLAYSLKPLIDLIYAKRECCEIDPARLKAGDVLEKNQVSAKGFNSSLISPPLSASTHDLCRIGFFVRRRIGASVSGGNERCVCRVAFRRGPVFP